MSDRRFFGRERAMSYITHMDERRRSPRVPLSVYLSQHVEGHTHRCFTSDVSADGLYMERPIGSFLRHSTSVQLEIPIPDGHSEPLWASAEVVYDCFDALFHGMAVRFTTMSTPDRARLAAFLASAPESQAA